MRSLDPVDSLYEDFARSLGAALVEPARALAVTLKLAPERGIPWSGIFSHEVTLAAPALLAEALSEIEPAKVEAAVCAHMLAVLEAFGTDRVADRQVEASPELLTLLASMRDARDAALRRIGDPAGLSFAEADGRTRSSIAREAEIFRLGRTVSFGEYEAVSFGKQAVGFPASSALFSAAGRASWSRGAVVSLLGGVWLGLQMGDDVVDWEEDAARGGAWAVALSGSDAGASPSAVRDRIFERGILPRMLARAGAHFRAARRRASALGAKRLELWCGEREGHVERLLAAEQQSPGYVRRERALGAWAAEVLG